MNRRNNPKPSVNLSEKWVGQRFGKLTVIGFGYDSKHYRNTWKCLCDCGNSVEVYPANAKAGRVRSCGCAQLEVATIHGQRHTRLYGIWVGMRRRCRNERHANYVNYGARGIKVCKEWESFELFAKWAYSHGYSDNLSIDRIDVNGNYEPSNCRWVDDSVQMNNRRTTRKVIAFGQEMSVADALAKYGNGLRRDTFLKRIDVHGYTVEEALTREVRRPFS